MKKNTNGIRYDDPQSYRDGTNYIYRSVTGNRFPVPINEIPPEVLQILFDSDEGIQKNDRRERNHRVEVYQNEKSCDGTESCDFREDPMENIADPRADIYLILFGKDVNDSSVSREEIYEKVRFFLESLSESQRFPFEMHYQEKKTFEEIAELEAEKTGKLVSKQAVAKRVYKIKAKLFEMINQSLPVQNCTKNTVE